MAIAGRAVARAPLSPPTLPAISSSPDDTAARLEDAAHLAGGHARGIVYPGTEAEVAAVCALGVPLLPIGAQSSVTGGATPMGELLVSTARLTSIQWAGNDCVRAGAGVPLTDLEAFLRARGRTYPPAPTWTAATVGGIVSTNAAGPATFKHGVTRDWVTALTVVLPGGDVLDLVRGQIVTAPDGRLVVDTRARDIELAIPALPWPDVPKRSAGYFCTRGMDLIDLFIGAEGTLGIVVDVTLRTVPATWARARAMVPCPDEDAAIAFVDDLRAASWRTWEQDDPHGLDVSAIEHLDRRSLEIVIEDGVDRREHLLVPAGTSWLLFVDLDLPASLTREAAWAQVEQALDPDAPDGPIVRFCRLADRRGLLDGIELALPGDGARLARMSALREAVPAGVNARIARARAAHGPAVRKVAADMIVPWRHVRDLVRVCHEVFGGRGLDHAVWGHISDGNLHPNVLPASAADIETGEAAVLELGQAVLELGGSPLAEHGVGRLPVKKQLLRMLHGEAGVAAMRAIKRAIDPSDLLAPGVLF